MYGGEARVVAVHPAQGAGDQHRRRRAAAFAPRATRAGCGRAAAVCASRRSGDRSGTCRGGTTPCVPEPTLPFGATRSFRARAPAVVRLETRVAGGVEVEPGLGVVLVASVERELGVGRVQREEAEDLAVRSRRPSSPSCSSTSSSSADAGAASSMSRARNHPLAAVRSTKRTGWYSCPQSRQKCTG